ncbi:hypothetical protein [Pseudomonas sp. Teo4]|uniref:hypothetical protein n=1 Tax=Pseudomonas sp. Teo4 TaxID=3064528 RepID=UPI002ACB0C8B|nr:hypothetical protein [Pseudomonas sp. Teo4]
MFNGFGNTVGISTLIIVGLILQATGSFEIALVFVAAMAEQTCSKASPPAGHGDRKSHLA